jgi:hypothetical protein
MQHNAESTLRCTAALCRIDQKILTLPGIVDEFFCKISVICGIVGIRDSALWDITGSRDSALRGTARSKDYALLYTYTLTIGVS